MSRILHLTFHQGCLKAFEHVANIFRLELESWFIPTLKPLEFDGTSSGNVLYNIDHDRAERIWNKHASFFNTFDIIITSDTAPLARIFLQNSWSKPLIIWICNRFDYHDGTSKFPDPEYYELFKSATSKSNVKIIAYTDYEHYYCKSRGVITGGLTITPFFNNTISNPIIKKKEFFLPPYHNETIFFPEKGKTLSPFLNEMGIPNYCGRYGKSEELCSFIGIIHLPYAWSNISLFENISLGIPYFIPSIKFFMKLLKIPNYFHQNSNDINVGPFRGLNVEKSRAISNVNVETIILSEWYKPERKEIFIYFDSWQDLKNKTLIYSLTDGFNRDRIKTYNEKYSQEMINKWNMVFNN